MTALTAFIPYVTPHATGCADIVAKRAIIEAIDQFCKDSWYYRDRQVAQRILGTDTVVGDFDTDFSVGITVNGSERWPIVKTNSEQYVLTAPAGMRPYQVIDIWAGTTALKPLTEQTVAEVVGWAEKTGEDSRWFTRVASAVTEVFPTPDTPQELTLVTAYVPLHNATEVPDSLFADYRDIITAGALASLYSTPNQPFTKIELVPDYRGRFRKGIAMARIRNNQGHTRATVQPRPRNWA